MRLHQNAIILASVYDGYSVKEALLNANHYHSAYKRLS